MWSAGVIFTDSHLEWREGRRTLSARRRLAASSGGVCCYYQRGIGAGSFHFGWPIWSPSFGLRRKGKQQHVVVITKLWEDDRAAFGLNLTRSNILAGGGRECAGLAFLQPHLSYLFRRKQCYKSNISIWLLNYCWGTGFPIVLVTCLRLLGPWVVLLGGTIITTCPLPAGAFWMFACDNWLWRFGENVSAEWLGRHGSRITDLLFRNSWCLFFFISSFISFVSISLVGLRHEVTLLRQRRCSCLCALSSASSSKPFTGAGFMRLRTKASIHSASEKVKTY